MMSNSLSLVTPFRPDLIEAIPSHVWADLEISMGLLVIALTFMQKAWDSSQNTGGAIGVFSFLSMVWKVGFSFLVVLDGAYVATHLDTEHVRPIASLAMFTIASQQVRLLITQWTTDKIMAGRRWAFNLVGPEGRRVYASPLGFWAHRDRWW